MNENQTDYLIDLNKFDKNKTWIIFYKKGCCNCHAAMQFFKAKDIKYYKYDIDTKEGLAVAAIHDIIEECNKKGVPIIIEDIEK